MEGNNDNNNNNRQQQQQPPQQQHPSLLGGHAQYIKGAAEETIGNLSGSQAWTTSGEQDKAAGLETMKQAGEQRDASHGYGKIEELAGRATGCEGMRKEGAASRESKDK